MGVRSAVAGRALEGTVGRTLWVAGFGLRGGAGGCIVDDDDGVGCGDRFVARYGVFALG